MFTWPIVLLVVLGISSLLAAGVMSLKLNAFSSDGEGQDQTPGPNRGP